MGMLSRLRKRLESRIEAQPERFAFAAEVPAGHHGAICRVQVQVLVEPQQDGDRLRLRAHMQTNLASVLRPALRRATDDPIGETAPSASRSLVPATAERAAKVAGRGLQRVLSTRLAQRLTEPLLQRDYNTWIEVQASTEPLNEGAHSLVPQQEKLAELGIRPRKPDQSGPVAESWGGRTASGYAQLSLLQIDKSDLPPDLQRRFGAQPFHMAAAIVSTAERK